MLQDIITLEEKLNPRHTAVLVVDVQNDFCHPDGFFALAGVTGFSDISMVPAMKRNLYSLIDSARRSGVMLVFIRAIYDPIYVSAPFAERLREIGSYGKACLDGTWGADYYEDIRPVGAPCEIEVVKHRFSAFQGTDLDLILRSNEVKTLVMTGVVTSGCVDSTAREGFFRDYYIILAGDCVADWDADNHQAALRKFQRTFGYIVPASEIVKIWTGTTAK